MNSSPVVPVYYQIKQFIKNWIINREFSPGDRIPTEYELADRFNVSRLTVHQAISQLSQEGFMITKRGEGTFVTKDTKLINSFSLEFTGFMDDLFYQISRSRMKSVRMDRIIVPKVIKEKLELRDDEEEVVQIKRVRFLEGKPFAFTVNYLPVEIGVRVREKDLYKKPLLQIFEQDLGIQFGEAFQTIQASFADQEISEQLGWTPASPILFAERIMYDRKDKPFELVQSSYRGDLYIYKVDGLVKS